jgi:peptide/nickel transport system substrate-binding protein
VTTGRQSRRSFLAGTGLSAVSVALLAACGQPAPPAAPKPVDTPRTVDAPKPAEAAKPAAEAPKPAAPAPAATTAPAAAAKPAAAAPTAAAKVAEAPKPKTYLLDKVPANLSEAPMLADMVKAGKLPPLKERIPEEPVVLDRKGKYGGVMRSVGNAKDLFIWSPVKYGGGIQGTPLRLAPDLRSWVPNVLKNVEMSKDAKTLTATMRKGMKWSDGQPHTADDWVFWYENILADDDVHSALTGPIRQVFTFNGQLIKLSKIDEYSFKIDFPGPNPSFPLVNFAHVFGFSHDNAVPAHYLKQFHGKFNDKAGEQAKAAGFESWATWFVSKKEPDQNPEVPRLGAYVVDTVSPSMVTFKRNPYYWMVDSEGKQLPYLDGMSMERIDDLTAIEAKGVAGNYDFVCLALSVKNFKTYKEAEAKGGFKTLTWKSGKGAEMLFNFNMNYPDEVWRNIFSDVRFRRAMSVALNRAEMNEVLFFGLGTPAQFTAHTTSRAYNEEYAKAWAQYDPELGNKLLDEMGLKMDPATKIRTLPNGQPMQIQFDWNNTQSTAQMEMCVEYWRKIGVQVDYKPVLRPVLRPKITANQMMMSSWGGDEVLDTLLARRPKWFTPHFGDEGTWAPLWGQWYFTKGKQGQEPPPEIKALYDAMDNYAATDDVKYVDQLLKSQADNVWSVGTVADAPVPMIFSKDLKNVPETEYWVWDALDGNESYPEAWYFDR